MKKTSNPNTQLLKLRSVAGIFLILIGLGLTLFFGLRAFHSFRRMPPFPSRPPEASESDVETIRPWMNIKFISQAYGFPIDYLLSYLELPREMGETKKSLEDVNQELGWGDKDGSPVIIERIKFAITEFNTHPIERDLKEIMPSMSIQFISTKARVPADYIFEEIGLPKTGNEYKSVELLSQEQNYAGGAQALAKQIQIVIDSYPGQ